MNTNTIKKYEFSVEVKHIAEIWDFCKRHEVNLHWIGVAEGPRAYYSALMCSDTYLLLKLIVQSISDVKR